MKRTLEDTPNKTEQRSDVDDQDMNVKSGSEEEYVPGHSKLNKNE